MRIHYSLIKYLIALAVLAGGIAICTPDLFTAPQVWPDTLTCLTLVSVVLLAGVVFEPDARSMGGAPDAGFERKHLYPVIAAAVLAVAQWIVLSWMYSRTAGFMGFLNGAMLGGFFITGVVLGQTLAVLSTVTLCMRLRRMVDAGKACHAG